MASSLFPLRGNLLVQFIWLDKTTLDKVSHVVHVGVLAVEVEHFVDVPSLIEEHRQLLSPD